MENNKQNPYQATEIKGKWYVTGDGLKIPVKSQEHANILANVIFNIEITDPNFSPGRRKKSV
jgi:hypothetical protein